jgi:hypothetical protein
MFFPFLVRVYDPSDPGRVGSGLTVVWITSVCFHCCSLLLLLLLLRLAFSTMLKRPVEPLELPLAFLHPLIPQSFRINSVYF